MSQRTRICALRGVALGVVLVSGGCSGANGYTQSPEQMTPRVDIVAGDNQSVPVSMAFPIRMKVFFNKNGIPLDGHTIMFNAPEQGAGGTFPDNALSVTVVTDAGGYAEAPAFTANGTPGSYTILAWNTSYRANFHVTNQ